MEHKTKRVKDKFMNEDIKVAPKRIDDKLEKERAQFNELFESESSQQSYSASQAKSETPMSD